MTNRGLAFRVLLIVAFCAFSVFLGYQAFGVPIPIRHWIWGLILQTP